MIDTILFDLDGTLADVDIEAFKRDYFALLWKHFSKHMSLKLYEESIHYASHKMMNEPHPDKTNQAAFFETFFRRTLCPLDVMYLEMERFYLLDFPRLKRYVCPKRGINNVLTELKNDGFNLVLATNPTFPLEVILMRLEWGGVDSVFFDFITSYEIMYSCKPTSFYFQEIIKRINKEPEKCIMIGNDKVNDTGGEVIGIKTCIIENCDKFSLIEGITGLIT